MKLNAAQTCVFRRSSWVSWPVHCVAFALQQECGTELLCWINHVDAVQSVKLFTPQHSNWECKKKKKIRGRIKRMRPLHASISCSVCLSFPVQPKNYCNDMKEPFSLTWDCKISTAWVSVFRPSYFSKTSFIDFSRSPLICKHHGKQFPMTQISTHPILKNVINKLYEYILLCPCRWSQTQKQSPRLRRLSEWW